MVNMQYSSRWKARQGTRHHGSRPTLFAGLKRDAFRQVGRRKSYQMELYMYLLLDYRSSGLASTVFI